MNKPKIIYLYDALCGWCYGFSPVMQQIHSDFRDSADFEVLSGGLIQGDRVGPISKIAPYIKSAYKDVEERTGVVFGEKFVKGTLEQGTMILDSLPPSTALSIVKELKPEKSLEFAHLLHQAIYSDGVEPAEPGVFAPYAEKIGIDPVEFNRKMEDPDYADKAFKDFADAGAFGISGFPTLVMEHNDRYYLISRGYTDYKQVEAMIQYVMSGEAEKEASNA